MENKQLVTTSNIPTDHELTVYNTMAKQAVQSKFYRRLGDENAVMMIMLSARELGIPAMQALNGGLHMIEGKVEISARMMSALIRKAGHSLQIKRSDEEECCLVGKRADNGDTATVSFSIEQARKAGLIKSGGGWVKWAEDMLFARALSRLARQLFSDVVGVGYVEGEISQREPKERPLEACEDNCVVLEDYPEQKKQDFMELLNGKEEKEGFEKYKSAMQGHFNWSDKEFWMEFLKVPEESYERFKQWLNR